MSPRVHDAIDRRSLPEPAPPFVCVVRTCARVGVPKSETRSDMAWCYATLPARVRRITPTRLDGLDEALCPRVRAPTGWNSGDPGAASLIAGHRQRAEAPLERVPPVPRAWKGVR